MKHIPGWTIVTIAIVASLAVAQEAETSKQAWKKAVTERTQRGTLRDAYQYVRGDSGKWNDDARLQRIPPASRKPPKVPLDDWAESLQEKPVQFTTRDDNWVLFHSRQLNDNDRLWIESIERNGDAFTIIAHEAQWRGKYGKNFTYHSVIGVNLGKLAPGEYTVKWTVKPLDFNRFESNDRPRKPQDDWPKDERPAQRKAQELALTFTVVETKE